MTAAPPDPALQGGGETGRQMLTLYTHDGKPVEYPQPKSKATFNLTRGPGVSWARWTWGLITGCLHGCEYCLTPETPVLMADLTTRPVGDLRAGDKVAAFDEYPARPGIGRLWQAAEVTDTWRTVQAGYRIQLAGGTAVTASAAHKWLCAVNGRKAWLETSRLRPGTEICGTHPEWPVTFTGSLAVRQIRPDRAVVSSVTPVLATDMVDITTTTGTFIAAGLLTHNCYAREIAHAPRTSWAFPAGFTPLLHRERLDAPLNTVIPAAYRADPAWWQVFVCSMGDAYGRWVPDEWVDLLHYGMNAAPWWQYILLSKFPGRYPGLVMPPGAWVGASVDEQKRVRITEEAMRNVTGVAVKWLSLEPLREPLQFTDLSMFNWIVIGAQTATRQPGGPVPAFAPPFEWVARIVAQAREAGCRIHLKPNLLGATHGKLPGMQLPDEYPDQHAVFNQTVKPPWMTA